MKKQDVIEHYGSVKAAAIALKITVQAVYAWSDPPSLSVQNKVEWESKGKLVAEHPSRRSSDLKRA